MSDQAAPSSIAFAWLYTAWGGAEIQLLHLARHAPAGTRVTVIAPRSTDATLRALWSELPHTWIDTEHFIDVRSLGPERPDGGRPAKTSQVGDRVRRGLNTLRAGAEFRRAVGGLDPAVVVHVDIPPWSALLALVATARVRPVVLTWHTPLTLDRGPRSMIVSAKLALLGRMRRFHVVAASGPARADAARWFRRAITDVTVMPAGFDPGEIDAVRLPDQVDDLIVGVGTLTQRKGVDLAIEALRRLHDRGRVVRLIWLGDGEERRPLQHLIDRHGLSASIELRAADTSAANRLHLLHTVAGATVYIQPSRLDGLPLATIEAMALSRPVIATRVGAMSDLGELAGVTWVPTDDLERLVDALDRLLGDGGHRRQLGKQGRDFVADRYDMRRAAADAYAYYAIATEHRWHDR